MKSKRLIKEIHQLQKIAGILKEDDFDLPDESPFNSVHSWPKQVPAEFYFGYDVDNIESVEDYVGSNYILNSGMGQFTDPDAEANYEYGEDTMNMLTVYNPELLRDRVFRELVQNCDGSGFYGEEEEEY